MRPGAPLRPGYVRLAVDPWEVLGLDEAQATAEDVRSAKRRLAKLHHPDLVAGGGGGDGAVADASARQARVNHAAERALADLASRPPRGPAVAEAAAAADVHATFTIESLPVEAFELVLLAFSSIGDPKVVEEPYLLEGQVDDPVLGFARVELAPEAGGSIVTVTTWPTRRAVGPAPTANQVASRLLWEVRVLEER